MESQSSSKLTIIKVDFVYTVAGHFLEPFRGMFPPKQISTTSYFSSAGLFAIIFYSKRTIDIP